MQHEECHSLTVEFFQSVDFLTLLFSVFLRAGFHDAVDRPVRS